jgi:hypothetical protein
MVYVGSAGDNVYAFGLTGEQLLTRRFRRQPPKVLT